MESCPNPKCGRKEPMHISSVYNKGFVAVCNFCGMSGPMASTPEEAEILWNSLPREVVKKYKPDIYVKYVWLYDDGIPHMGGNRRIGVIVCLPDGRRSCSMCSPLDSFDKKRGIRIAMGRAMKLDVPTGLFRLMDDRSEYHKQARKSMSNAIAQFNSYLMPNMNFDSSILVKKK